MRHDYHWLIISPVRERERHGETEALVWSI